MQISYRCFLKIGHASPTDCGRDIVLFVNDVSTFDKAIVRDRGIIRDSIEWKEEMISAKSDRIVCYVGGLKILNVLSLEPYTFL